MQHGDVEMARNARTIHRQGNEKIFVSAFKDIHIHFPGDVYILAIWVAMSNRAQCTPTCMLHTTLHGFANHFVSLYGINDTKPLTKEDVLAVFRDHGITGNPMLLLDTKEEMSPHQSLIENPGML